MLDLVPTSTLYKKMEALHTIYSGPYASRSYFRLGMSTSDLDSHSSAAWSLR